MKTLKRFFLFLLAIELILIGFYCVFQTQCKPSPSDDFFQFCRNSPQRTIEVLALIPMYIGILVLIYSKPLIKHLKLR